MICLGSSHLFVSSQTHTPSPASSERHGTLYGPAATANNTRYVTWSGNLQIGGIYLVLVYMLQGFVVSAWLPRYAASFA